MSPPPVIIFRRRRVFARVASKGHPLDGAIVERTGIGRGRTVYGTTPDGVEHVFRNDQLEEVAT